MMVTRSDRSFVCDARTPLYHTLAQAIIIDLTCRQSKTYSPLPRWLKISVANTTC
ncbi:hypothetical protein T03_15662 [Trichinella britovi]|uniref:Uncharacterized protein n=1 Tax=Trichinella britovi TaxID=45882 RepID=A0A0V1CM45_TRIBR|nr:hypothetical protein T03_15662 [Trichinella britovi]